MNRPSKKRITVFKEEFQSLGDGLNNLQSDVGGNGGNVYLLDYEDLKKALNAATGST